MQPLLNHPQPMIPLLSNHHRLGSSMQTPLLCTVCLISRQRKGETAEKSLISKLSKQQIASFLRNRIFWNSSHDWLLGGILFGVYVCMNG